MEDVSAVSATVRDIMTARVIAVRADARFKKMAAVPRSSRISALPVVDGEMTVIGVSDADLLAKPGRPGRPAGSAS
jgi:predicted transcriptional regulator